MPSRQHICDVPGCGASRSKWQRLCARCFKALPADLRTKILQCWKFGYKAQHREHVKHAGEIMAPIIAGGASATVSPAEAYERQQRLLGERS